MSIFGHHNSLVVTGGQFTQHNETTVTTPQTAFDRLLRKVAQGAFHNSGEGFDPPQCHPRTRLAVTQKIMNWITCKEFTECVIMWLHGAAGAGKSAIAQRIAQLCYEDSILVASYFCSRSDPQRNNANSIFPTIAYQITCAIPEVLVHVEEAINHDPLIFTRSLETQMVALIAKPLQTLANSGFFSYPSSYPRLIIIDGLDEILDRKAQEKILTVVPSVLQRYRIPLIFLIASRPEQEISYAFSIQPLISTTHRLLLDDTFHPDHDIWIFLVDSLSEIKASHPRKESIPSSWPSDEILRALVFKSSGQFIYAATVIRYLKTIRTRPTDQLDIVLGLRPATNNQDLPFSELDALYIHIFQMLTNPKKTLLILGMLHCIIFDNSVNPITTADAIEQLLELDPGEVEFLLADMNSLISCHPERHTYHILHASLGDFLFDLSRSGDFYIDKSAMHTIMAYNCLRQIDLASHSNPQMEDWGQQYPIYAIQNAAAHLHYGRPTLELLEQLKGLSLQLLFDNVSQHLSLYPHSHYKYSQLQYVIDDIIDFCTYEMDEMKHSEHSEHHRIQCCLVDRVVKSQLDIAYAKLGPSMLDFNCLIQSILKSPILLHPTGTIRKWFLAAAQLINCYFYDIPSQRNIFLALLANTEYPVPFFADSTRAGKYEINAKTYASLALRCSRYLCNFHLKKPINIAHNNWVNLAMRHNNPRKWRIHRKYLHGLHIPRSSKYAWNMSFESNQYSPSLLCRLPGAHKAHKLQAIYSEMRRLSLNFLLHALSKSAKSNELIAFATSERLFSHHMQDFPVEVKKCRAAFDEYLERVQK